ncbi:four helix bundle protein [Rufibacter glacialis]|uniref:Four helix bundle protein n=1 Tax=Rufibacter glacialis TaxID=1259555 RepID=A0A5M8QIH3_9BACT|nr:four helix bundle protein [Rufibacter glacialis]KAA6434586.1 four helix bundle protein [Rufibacter glacialis]GGK70795.1 hypothetical protein GCM10011405_18700 [Rufibacter glacialis]
MEKQQPQNLILDLTLDFSVSVIEYAEQLEAQRKFVVANQLLKSGTSIGANVKEAQNAESKADFIHKFKIAAKEVEETEYWLMLCHRAPTYPNPDHLQKDLHSIKKIISKIIISSKTKN